MMLPLLCGNMTRNSCFMLRSVPRTLVSKATLLVAPAGNDDASSFLRESDGGSPANASQGTSDENNGIGLS
jgi:hypothetical protein